MVRVSKFLQFSFTTFSLFQDLFSNAILVMLFKCCENIYRWKSVIEIHIGLFKQWKLFKQRYQTAPNFQNIPFSVCSK